MSGANPDIIGGFRILGSLKGAAGSQGAVLKAVCETPSEGIVLQGAVVALKVMMDTSGDPRRWNRLEARTRALAALSHDNIVRYLGCFRAPAQFGEMHVVVQEFLEGETLKERLARGHGGLDVDEALEIVKCAAEGLRHAAENGIVHRDVKPGNIFVCLDGAGGVRTVKMIDFEIAHVEQDASAPSTSGAAQGTFDYIAPEFTDPSFKGDEASDVFSLGVVLHEALSGRLPYKRASEAGVRADIAFYNRWSPKEDGSHGKAVRMDDRIRHILSRADVLLSKSLARDRAERYPGFAGFLADLRAVRFKDIRNGERRYRLLKFIGRGGFGEVFKARFMQTRGIVAIKHLLDSSYSERFEREMKVMRKLYDPAGRFVKFVDFIKVSQIGGNTSFLVMDFLDGMPGSSLRDAIRARRADSSRDEVLAAFVRYAQGLARMHSIGIIHRDIKPSNLYYPLGHPERAAIMDLGIARDINGTVTNGGVPGTLDYMPPEVVTTSERGDARTDIYALGLCLYEALTGKTGYPRLPTGTAGFTALLERARTRVPPVFDDPAILNDAPLHSLLVEMTAPDASLRIGNASIVAEKLERLIGSRNVQPPAPPVPPVPRPAAPPPVTRTATPRPIPTPTPAPRRRSEPKPIAHPPKRPVVVPHRPVLPELLRAISSLGPGAAICAGVVCVLALALFFCGPILKEQLATWQMKKVLEAYAADPAADENTVHSDEIAWRANWNPSSSSWVTLDVKTFEKMSAQFEGGKKQVFQRRREDALARKRAAERAEWLELFARCLRPGGGLDEAGYLALEGKTMPQWLAESGDAEVAARQKATASALCAAIKAKLEVEPIATRQQRRDAAERLFNASWTKRLLWTDERTMIADAFARWSRTKVLMVANACAADAIKVEGRMIPAGGVVLFVFEDGIPPEMAATREGFERLELKVDASGERVTVKDSDFVAKPLRVEFPTFEQGVRCAFQGREVRSGETVMLKPGRYTCVYSRNEMFEDVDGRSRLEYLPQTNGFSVSMGAITIVPAPPAKASWPKTQGYLSRQAAMKSHSSGYSSVPGAAPALDGNPAAVGRDGLARRVLDKCNSLLAVEPVETRQDRLEQAGIILTRAEGIDHIITADDARPMFKAIDERKGWEAGWVCNKCPDTVCVAGFPVAGGERKLLVFKEGLPERWTATRDGYEPKSLVRDFDGRVITIQDADFVPRHFGVEK